MPPAHASCLNNQKELKSTGLQTFPHLLWNLLGDLGLLQHQAGNPQFMDQKRPNSSCLPGSCQCLKALCTEEQGVPAPWGRRRAGVHGAPSWGLPEHGPSVGGVGALCNIVIRPHSPRGLQGWEELPSRRSLPSRCWQREAAAHSRTGPFPEGRPGTQDGAAYKHLPRVPSALPVTTKQGVLVRGRSSLPTRAPHVLSCTVGPGCFGSLRCERSGVAGSLAARTCLPHSAAPRVASCPQVALALARGSEVCSCS